MNINGAMFLFQTQMSFGNLFAVINVSTLIDNNLVFSTSHIIYSYLHIFILTLLTLYFRNVFFIILANIKTCVNITINHV